MSAQSPTDGHRQKQFSLAALFEFTALCAVLSALSPNLGIIPLSFLILMALSLGARQGLLAIAMFAAASISCDIVAKKTVNKYDFTGQATILLIGFTLCGWYLLRRCPAKSSVAEAKGVPKNSAPPNVNGS
jgi:hypothetical protein